MCRYYEHPEEPQREAVDAQYCELLDDEAEPQAVVWVEHPPNLTDVRQRLISTADEAGLGPDWIRSWKGYWALRRHTSFAMFADLTSMRDWWWARLEELDEAGIVELIPQLPAMGSPGVLTMAWTQAGAALPLGWRLNGVWHFETPARDVEFFLLSVHMNVLVRLA